MPPAIVLEARHPRAWPGARAWGHRCHQHLARPGPGPRVTDARSDSDTVTERTRQSAQQLLSLVCKTSLRLGSSCLEQRACAEPRLMSTTAV